MEDPVKLKLALFFAGMGLKRRFGTLLMLTVEILNVFQSRTANGSEVYTFMFEELLMTFTGVRHLEGIINALSLSHQV